MNKSLIAALLWAVSFTALADKATDESMVLINLECAGHVTELLNQSTNLSGGETEEIRNNYYAVSLRWHLIISTGVSLHEKYENITDDEWNKNFDEVYETMKDRAIVQWQIARQKPLQEVYKFDTETCKPIREDYSKYLDES